MVPMMPRLLAALLLTMALAQPAAACRLPEGLETARAEVLAAINAIRAGQGLAALRADARLQAAAQGHACDSAAAGRMDHISPDGRTMQDRVDATGYDWRQLAENIAYGQPSGTEVVRTWLQSPPHRKNMMMRAARDAGVGAAVQPDGKIHWVLNLGRGR
ncbi:MAG: hypothetical protein RIR62_636 [Pseudomonadota bacterium]